MRFENKINYTTAIEEIDGRLIIFNFYNEDIDKTGKGLEENSMKALFETIADLIKPGNMEASEGSIFEINEAEINERLGFVGGILINPLLGGMEGDNLQFIPLYKEEVSFAKRIGWRKLRNMFKFLTPEEANIAKEGRYNIITDIDGRRNCF